MTRKLFKYLWIFVLILGLVGGCSWVFSRWKMMNEPTPDGAMKVMGYVRNG